MDVDAFMYFLEPRPKSERWDLIDGIPVLMDPVTMMHRRVACNGRLGWRRPWRRKAAPPDFSSNQTGWITTGEITGVPGGPPPLRQDPARPYVG